MKMSSTIDYSTVEYSKYLIKNINDIKDVGFFKSRSPAHKNLTTFVDAMCSRIHGQGRRFSPLKYEIKNHVITKIAEFLTRLGDCCKETDLKSSQTDGSARFGLAAFRDWFDQMKGLTRKFIDEDLIPAVSIQYKEEIKYYFTESFGNRMRIDYGTGHELNFIIFMMGLCDIVRCTHRGDDNLDIAPLQEDKILDYVKEHGFDLHTLFSNNYIRLCRRVQSKFRLEPAGSRGVYNMDDYQFLPFLFGAAQLCNTRGISVKQFYDPDMVEMLREDYIFFEAIDFILKIKRGPFNEHSYTLWNYSGLGTWENIYRRIRAKFNDEVLSPFPVVQHLLFGKFILCWDKIN